jgi:hypothetical protein
MAVSMAVSTTSARLVPALLVLAVVATACVKDDPIVTGHRDAAAAPPVIAKVNVVPKPDDPDVDAPDCRTCGDTLNTSSSRGTLCRKNGRGSAVILNELVDCVCKNKCVEQCTSYCSGSTREGSCLPCIINGCQDIFTECGADLKPQ